MTEWTFPLEAGHIMQFRRAVGSSTAPVAPDAVPPTFLAASEHYRPDSRLRPAEGMPWRGSGAGVGSASSGPGSLHAEQHYEYHRPLRAGETLTVRDAGLRTWSRTGSAGQLLNFTERTTRYVALDGSDVVTERRITVVVGDGGAVG